MPEIAFMCPDCHAITGGGDYDNDALKEIEHIAGLAKLTVLRMWAEPGASTHCTCPAPNALTRFVALLQLNGYETEYKDKTTGRRSKGLPADALDAMKLPTLSGNACKADPMKEIERVRREMEAKTGIPVRSVGLRGLDPKSVKLPDHLKRFSVIKAFSVDGYDATFAVISLAKWPGAAIRIVEEHGYQVWPKDPTEELTVKNLRKALPHLDSDVVIPFVTRLQGVTNDALKAWQTKCLETTRSHAAPSETVKEEPLTLRDFETYNSGLFPFGAPEREGP